MSIDNPELAKLVYEIKSIPIAESIGDELGWVSNKQADVLCPNPGHQDQHKGNAKIFRPSGGSHELIKCHTCGWCGDAIAAYQALHNVSFKQAAIELADKLNLYIPESLRGGKAPQRDYNKVIEHRVVKKMSEPNLPAAPEKLNAVYKALIESSTLSYQHKNMMKAHYGMSDQETEHCFTFPKKMPEGFADRFDLSHVPGFFYNTKQQEWGMSHIPKDAGGAIGIPIHDIDGNIVAIQLRKDKTDGKIGRYQWFSSAWADKSGAEEKYTQGTGSGSPVDVVLPPNGEKPHSTLFVTEGHFKAYRVAKEFNATCLSVQGVTNWRRELLGTIAQTMEKQGQKRVFIAYDADMATNRNVLAQTLALGFAIQGRDLSPATQEVIDGRQLSPDRYIDAFIEMQAVEPKVDLPVFVCLWDQNLGKGIDDLLAAGHGAALFKESLDVFFTDMCKIWMTQAELGDAELSNSAKATLFYDSLSMQPTNPAYKIQKGASRSEPSQETAFYGETPDIRFVNNRNLGPIAVHKDTNTILTTNRDETASLYSSAKNNGELTKGSSKVVPLQSSRSRLTNQTHSTLSGTAKQKLPTVTIGSITNQYSKTSESL